jgi:pyruvate/2-oxoglutarate dehydrogenase complex dihydrolipoamide dehydrogenase (E3) component
MDDVIVIGGGPAGEAAAHEARTRGATVTVIERDLMGGECPFWACMPSKTLLNQAARRHGGLDVAWKHASDRRDWMISREGTPYPSDAGHVRSLEAAGARVIRGTGRIAGPGRVEVTVNDGGTESVEARSVIVSAGSTPVVPPIPGISDAGYWTNREATSARELPSSLVVLGGGPVGDELSQVYARFDVRVTLIAGGDRILPRDHPLSSQAVADQLSEEGVDIRYGARAESVTAGGPGRIVHLSDGTTAEGAELLLAVGRRGADLRALGTEEAGATLNDRGVPEVDEQLRAADGLFVAGDAAGGLQFTHVADYEGLVTARAATGGTATADLRSVPKSTFTDPEVGAVGMTAEEARAVGIDAEELSKDFARSGKGQTIEGSRGHLTIVFDKDRKVLVGAFAACPSGGELIHEATLALKAQIPLGVLADTIHSFPTAARVMGGLYQQAARQTGAI